MSDLTVTGPFEYVGSDYKLSYAPTNDPRVVAVIEREEEYGGGHIDGDCYAPAYYWDRQHGGFEEAGSTYRDDESAYIVERAYEARGRFYDARKPWAVMERWLRVFHGTSVSQVSSCIDRDAQVAIFNTPTWREATGCTELGAVDNEDWQAALDGEVYGIGYATFPERVTDEEPIDLEDGNWNVEIQVWGHLGEEYAQQSAAAFEAGAPELPELLDFAA